MGNTVEASEENGDAWKREKDHEIEESYMSAKASNKKKDRVRKA